MYREIAPDVFEQFTLPVFIHANGNETPLGALKLWTEAELSQIGFFRAREVEVPIGKRQIPGSEPVLSWINGELVLEYMLEDLPPPPPLEVTRAQAEMALYNYRLPDGSNPDYFGQYEELVQNHPYAAIRIWAKGAATWREDHPYIWALGELLVPPPSYEVIHDLFVAASAYE